MSTKVESYKVLKTPNGKIVKINNGKVIKPFFDGFCLVAEEPNSTVELVGINGADAYMYYSLDSWKTYQRYIIPSTTGTNVITLRNVGDSVVFAAYKSMMSYSSSKYLKFVLSGNISARGKFSSWFGIHQCYNLFKDCTALTSIEDLIVDQSGVYYYMFSGCTNLVSPPKITWTDTMEECYYGMFSGCTNLIAPPELPATTLKTDCYNSMFYNCTSLATAPALPATDINYDVSRCYKQMFYGCTSLVTAPALPINIGSSGFSNCIELYYQMFYGCTSLTTLSSRLPSCYIPPYMCYQMFYGCTALINLPEIYASGTTISGILEIDEYGCYQMFYGCSQIKVSRGMPTTSTWLNWSSMIKLGSNAATDMLVNTGGAYKKTPVVNYAYNTTNTIVK